jgi:GNAT superfamily N-acetyltransferase
VEQGVITGRRKTLHQGKIVSSFAAGTHALFRFLDNNPEIEMYPSDYTNDPRVICRHDNLMAINSAIEIDLTGQAVADSLGEQLYSGMGGHADFMRGAALARGGKPILALPSTALTTGRPSQPHCGRRAAGRRRDHHARRCPLRGHRVRRGLLARQDHAGARHVADLDRTSRFSLGTAARGQASPPGVREPDPVTGKPYPAELEKTLTLADGRELVVRPIRPDDESMMKGMFYSFSEQTKYLRYHGTLKSLPHNRLQVFCNVDYDTEMALVVEHGEGGHTEIIGVGRYLTTPDTQTAEMAFAIRDDWQRLGLGTHLFQRLAEIAVRSGIRQFHADVLPENSGMLKIFHRSGLNTETVTNEGVVGVVIRQLGRHGNGPNETEGHVQPCGLCRWFVCRSWMKRSTASGQTDRSTGCQPVA